MRMRGAVLGSAVALAWAMGCGGGDEAPAPTGAAMDSKPRAERARGSNAPPTIESVRFEPEAPSSGEPVRAVVAASDSDGDGIHYGFVWKLAGQPLAASGDRIDVAGARKGDSIEVVVTASDGSGQSEPFQARTRVGNAAPKLDQVAFEPAGELPAGTPITARPVARDPDGDALEFRYVWRVNGDEVPEPSGTLQTETLKRGDTIEVDVVASDGDDESEIVHAAGLRIVNDVPRIVSTPPSDLSGGVYRYRVEAKDADGDRTLRYRLAEGPPGMQVDALTGEVSWTPSVGEKGRHAVEIAVEDGQGGRTTQRFELSVAEEPAEAKPPAQATPASAGDDEGDESAAAPAPAPTPRRGDGRPVVTQAAPPAALEEEPE